MVFADVFVSVFNFVRSTHVYRNRLSIGVMANAFHQKQRVVGLVLRISLSNKLE